MCTINRKHFIILFKHTELKTVIVAKTTQHVYLTKACMTIFLKNWHER